MSNKQVDFVIVGAQKSGTTSLAGQLNQLDSICFCTEKEPHFFSKDKNWQNNIDKYLALYSDAPGQLLGEASTTYTFCDEYPDAIASLYEHNPNIKLIYLVRDPVARIESHFNHRLRNGRVTRDMMSSLGQHPCFFERSEYNRQLEHIKKTVPEQQIKVIIFEEYTKNPQKILAEVLAFLSLAHDQAANIDFSPKNVSDASLKMNSPLLKGLINLIAKLPMSYKLARWLPIKVKLSLAEKRVLWRTLEGDVSELEKHLNRPLTQWRSKYMYNKGSRL
ncbi:hypothetical protein A9Q74_02895 [Colwellia sp. 39_35_sub15_T18]|nr:hypothetical protein A9Q74_02895 [Colwellia sp. 39_35_sub15_T18]